VSVRSIIHLIGSFLHQNPLKMKLFFMVQVFQCPDP
jgi:hypothetical protein